MIERILIAGAGKMGSWLAETLCLDYNLTKEAISKGYRLIAPVSFVEADIVATNVQSGNSENNNGSRPYLRLGI